MLPTFQSFDDKKVTKTFPKRPIKLPKPIASKAPPIQKMKQMGAMTTASTTTAIADVINESAPSTPHPTTIPSTPISHTLYPTTDSNKDSAMIESSIQVSKRRLEALYTQFEENKNKIVDSSLQSKIQRSGSFTDVLSIISKFEMKKTEVEVESKYLEEAKENYIQALSKYDKKTIEALKEIGNEVQANPPRVLFKSPSAEFLPTMQIVPAPPSPILRSSIKAKNLPKGNVTPISFKLYKDD
uniref:Uncharacterized protein n=1 Tax=Meloidogyne javanica TaxID=6303 RepID=A0A915LZW9_MELJA